MVRNSTEQGAWWEVRSRVKRIRFFPAYLSRNQHNSPKHIQMWHYAGFKGGGVFALFSYIRVHQSSSFVLSLIMLLLHG